jgi:hypothetical protein
MTPAQLQGLLQDIYALEMSYDVHDFLITDEGIALALDSNGRRSEEKLLIAEQSAGDAHVSLYLASALIERLRRHNPANRLDGRNLGDFWTVVEGISHITYYAWNAMLEKSVTLLELELQAEIDKFVTTALLLEQQDGKLPAALHRWLFEVPSFDRRLSETELDRYRTANRFAGKYCLKLAKRLGEGLGREALTRELRRFYRLSQPAKLQHIEAG